MSNRSECQEVLTGAFEEVALALARGLGETFQAGWAVSEVTPQEEQIAGQLRARKYLNSHWTARGVSTLSRT